ncbi:hypothetical protein B0H11DRAFT_1898696 [Mycena galericulata]|nr:hypothetical protein B0H11DRAFT_1898696 [Mycena galericulata]
MIQTTSDTLTKLSEDLALKGLVDGIHALIFATGDPTPILVKIPIKSTSDGREVLFFEPHLYGTMSETNTTSAANVPLRIDYSSALLSGKLMRVIYMKQEEADGQMVNDAVAHLFPSFCGNWFGNIIVVACDDYIGNPENMSPDDVEVVHELVRRFVRDSLNTNPYEEEESD